MSLRNTLLLVLLLNLTQLTHARRVPGDGVYRASAPYMDRADDILNDYTQVWITVKAARQFKLKVRGQKISNNPDDTIMNVRGTTRTSFTLLNGSRSEFPCKVRWRNSYSAGGDTSGIPTYNEIIRVRPQGKIFLEKIYPHTVKVAQQNRPSTGGPIDWDDPNRMSGWGHGNLKAIFVDIECYLE